MNLTTALGIFSLALTVAACSDDESQPGDVPVPGCTLPFLGDAATPIEMDLVYLDAERTSRPLEDGGTLPMIVPPQGGWVVFVGARATNVDPCGLTIKGVLRDAATGKVRVDERTTKLAPDGDGWGGPIDGDISTFANVPTCPNQWASQALPGNPIEFTYTMTDRKGRSASKTLQVVLECGEPQFKNSCSCQCKADYKLGESCVAK